jgi:MFS family permease
MKAELRRGLLNRDLLLLLCSQIIFVSAGAMTVTMAGIVGSRLAPNSALATLPVSFMVLGTALAAYPAAQLMRHLGRRVGFVSAALMAVLSCGLGYWGLTLSSFSLYCGGTGTLGISLAFSQQFRFAATETVTPKQAGSAVSLLLLGSVGGAIVGPELVARSEQIRPEGGFVGALLGAAILFVLAAFLLSQLSLRGRGRTAEVTSKPVNMSLRIVPPLVWLAVAAGVVGQGVMTFVMTATPVSMHVMEGHSLSDTASVVRAHVLAMYLPSLVSGWLIARFGARLLLIGGIVTFAATMAAALAGQTVLHYGWAMVLLGAGWNFLFVGGTTLLVQSAHPDSQLQLQGYNDTAVFGSAAVASFAAGAVLEYLGWEMVVVCTMFPVLLLAVLWIRLRTTPLPSFDTPDL